MIWGYATAHARRAPVCADPEARAVLRDAQSLRGLRQRRRRAAMKTIEPLNGGAR